MTTKQKELYKLIEELLWREWDPIGLNDQEDGCDEYSGYVNQVFSLRLYNNDKKKITAHLFRSETVDMGMSGNLENCERVAQMVVDLHY